MGNCVFVASAMVVALVLPTAAWAEHVAGVVFLDANANGKLDPGEKGIQHVAVTDTLSFVMTDANGRYAIDAKADPLRRTGARPLVAISIPTGHWPTGAWFFRITDVEDESKVHFGLRRDLQEVPFTFVHGTDSHVPRGDTEDCKLFSVFKQTLARQADRFQFCVLTGDLVNLPDSDSQARGLADFALFGSYIADFPIALFCTPGNHDACGIKGKGAESWDKNHAMHGYGAYTHYVGPLRWSFTYASVHLVGLDFNTRTGGQWRTGALPEHAAKWLKADLKLAPKGSRIFLFIHHASALGSCQDLLKRYRVERIFDGHHHSVSDRRFAKDDEFEGIPAHMGGSLSSIKARPVGYRVVTVSVDGVEPVYTALLPAKAKAAP